MTAPRKPEFNIPKSGDPEHAVPARTVPGFHGQVPLPPGSVVLTDGEKQVLSRLGWKDGDPVPGNLPKLYAEAAAEKARAEQTTRQEIAAARKGKPTKLNLPQEVDLNALPAARQAELRAAVAQAKEVGIDPAAGGDYSPSVAAMMSSAQKGEVPTIELVQSVAPQAPPSAEDAGQPPPPLPGHPQMNAGGALAPAEPEITAADKMLYVQAILGMGSKRFCREYDFFGGRLKATFRTLTVAESERCLEQCSADTKEGKILTIDDFYRLHFDYRLCLSLHSLVINDAPIDVATSVDRALAEHPPGPGLLPRILEGLHKDESLCSESIWRLLGQTAQQFNRLVLAIEKKSADPDF
jgi:hypothetical protein